jgi:hypothetical protein
MAIRTHTSYYIEHDGQEFETEHQPEEGTEKVTIKGDKAVVSYLSSDPDARGWYFDEFEQGEFITFDPRSMGKKLELLDEETPRDAIARLKTEHPDRVFIINKYEHSLVRYYRQDDAATSATIPDQRWDVSHGCAVYIAPDDCPDPVKYCDSVMEEFTNWCNGDIHGICPATYKKVGDAWEQDGDGDACWGYIGYDSAKQELESEHEGYVKEL